jgi:hypothetical protein
MNWLFKREAGEELQNRRISIAMGCCPIGTSAPYVMYFHCSANQILVHLTAYQVQHL